ncbi:AAA family ATPase [Ralstonia insidiosa]|uniref:AAA family ATPase n=1 Tax=Ralstonia insidiosa TaxID=190721 RepID=A0A848NZR6_9RALS|nr:AAA family ATPase [Ralstonia insidiosa]NMV40901.1 AAA family ATPase [Ralstonia insidiosa]
MLTRQFVSHVTLRRDTITTFDAYPFNLPAVRALDTLTLHPKMTFLVGENGSGKSTLMEAMAVAMGFNAEGGSRNFNFSTHASHSELYNHLRIAKGFRKPRTEFFLRAESFFNVATNIQRMDEEPGPGGSVIASYGGKSLHAQSHGESFMALLMHRFGGNGLYLLDEPEAALSPQRQLAVLARMHALVRQESQFIIATHSPILMAYPDAYIYQCDGDGIRRIAYEETEHFQVTRDFLAHPQRMLNMLLDH